VHKAAEKLVHRVMSRLIRLPTLVSYVRQSSQAKCLSFIPPTMIFGVMNRAALLSHGKIFLQGKAKTSYSNIDIIFAKVR
jgi:hypothetical protein